MSSEDLLAVKRREPLADDDGCGDCVFFLRDEDVVRRDGSTGEAVRGTCRRHPPTVVVVADQVRTVWPQVMRWSDYCGEGERAVPDFEP